MMKKNNFYTILLTLDTKELRIFESHLKIHFKNSKVLWNIFNYYRRYSIRRKPCPELPAALYKIFKIEYKEKRDFVKLQNGLSDLYLILKDFLIQQKVLQTDFEKEFLWLKILENRALPHPRDLQLKKTKKHLAKKHPKTIWNPLHQLQLYHFEFFKTDFKKNNTSIQLVHEGLEVMDDFYISMKLKYAAENLNRKNLLNIPLPNIPLLGAILLEMKNNPTAYSLQSRLYYQVFIFLKNKSLKQFTQLKDFVFSNQADLHAEERLSALIYLINYLAKQLSTGKLLWIKATFELYEWGLAGDKILVQNGIMEALHFRNAVTVAVRLGNFLWSKNFIKQHEQYLEKDLKSENVSIGYAIVFFGEQQFQKVLDSFVGITFSEPIFEIQSRIYCLASNYELGNTDDLEMNLQTFTRFVKRNNKVRAQNKNAAINFARILLSLNRRKKYKKQIKESIDNADGLFFKPWLLEKLANYQRTVG